MLQVLAIASFNVEYRDYVAGQVISFNDRDQGLVDHLRLRGVINTRPADVAAAQQGGAEVVLHSAGSRSPGSGVAAKLRGLAHRSSMGRQLTTWSALTVVAGDATLVNVLRPDPDGAAKAVRLGYSVGGSTAQAGVLAGAYLPATGTFPSLGIPVLNPNARPTDFRIRVWNETSDRSIVYGGSTRPGRGFEFYTLSSLATIQSNWQFGTDRIGAVRVEQPTGAGLLTSGNGEWAAGEYLLFGPLYADIKGRPRMVLTFDDVPADVIQPYAMTAGAPVSGRSAKQMLDYFGFKGSVYLSSKVFNKNANGATTDHIKRLIDAGWAVGSHSRSHPVNAAGDGLRLYGPMGWNLSRQAGNGRNDCRVIGTAASTDTLTCEGNHNLSVGSKIVFYDVAPAGLQLGVTYWPFAVSGATFKVAATESLANAGTPIDLTSNWAGTAEWRFAGSAPDLSAIRADVRGGIDDISAIGITGHEAHFALPQGGWDHAVREACELEGIRVTRGVSSASVTARAVYVGPGRSCRPTGGTSSSSPFRPCGWPEIPNAISTDGVFTAPQAIAYTQACIDNGWLGGNYHHSAAASADVLHAFLADLAAKRDAGLIDVPTIWELDAELGCW